MNGPQSAGSRMQKAAALGFCFALLLSFLFTGCRSRDDNGAGLISPGGTESIAPRPTASASALPPSAPSSDPSSGDVYSLEEMYTRLKETYGENYYPNHRITADELENKFGIGSDLYDEFIADLSASEDVPDTLVLIRAREGREAEVRRKLEEYRQSLLSDADRTGNREKISASRVHADGRYVFYVMLGDAGDDTLSGEGLMEALGKEVDKGIQAIREFFETGSLPSRE